MTTPPPPRKPGPTLRGFRTPTDSRTLWFSRTGCVVWHASGRRDVLLGGTLVGSFEPGDTASRNVLLVLLAREDLVLEDLAHAFGVTSETLRLLRRAHQEGGFEALVKRKRGAKGPWKVTPKLRERAEECFAKGLTPAQTVREQKKALSDSTVRALHKAWRADQEKPPEPPRQAELSLPSTLAAADATPAPNPPEEQRTQGEEPARPQEGSVVAPKEVSSYSARASTPPADAIVDRRTLLASGPVSHRRVQFLGAWMLVALTARLGLHSAVTQHAKRGMRHSLRLAVDAVTIALGIGEGCVEGVRRLAHKSAASLLLSARAPSPAWVRSVLGAAAEEDQGLFIRAQFSGGLIRRATAGRNEFAVFYVDNHLRPYTGLQRLLRGWRMQDKRARSGTTDFHVHDRSGRPLYRVATPMHNSLGELLLPIGGLIRMALDPTQRILLAFDRAASYAEVMAELRDADFEFVAYEKKPFRPLPKRCFRKSFVLDGERIYFHEGHKNLGGGRGRVRTLRKNNPAFPRSGRVEGTAPGARSTRSAGLSAAA